jgi:hypothetical protein
MVAQNDAALAQALVSQVEAELVFLPVIAQTHVGSRHCFHVELSGFWTGLEMQPSGPAQQLKMAYAKRDIPFRIDDVSAVRQSEARSSRFPAKMA